MKSERIVVQDTVNDIRPIGYCVHTSREREEMLIRMGLESIDSLFIDVPEEIKLGRLLDLPSRLCEWALVRDVRTFSDNNATTQTHQCFLGGGAYEHYIPAVIDAIVSRGEFLTAYTPYQPEMSQGLLQALYEFQILVGRLLGLPSVNCSVYDGATALAEACWMMCSKTGKNSVVVVEALWPDYRGVLETYLEARSVRIVWVSQDIETGRMNQEHLNHVVADADCAGVVIQTPNALGIVEDVQAIATLCKQSDLLLCVAVNPMLCGLLVPPGSHGADIVICEGQPLGIPLSAGGPYVGIIATSKQMEPYIPGRLVGQVHDLNGKLAYALIKEDREQHVARDKATSHICSNQALNALRVLIYLATLGESNFMELARVNVANAEYLKLKILALSGVHLLRKGFSFNEFAIELPMPAQLFCDQMHALGIFAGLPIEPSLGGSDRALLIAVTETKTQEDLDLYVTHAAQCLALGEKK